jgi:hypothetical protein
MRINIDINEIILITAIKLPGIMFDHITHYIFYVSYAWYQMKVVAPS